MTTKSEKIASLIANKKATEEDRKGLELMSEATLNAMSCDAAGAGEEGESEDEDDGDGEVGTETGTEADGKAAKAKKLAETAPAQNAQAPALSPEDQAVLAFGRQELARRKSGLVDRIVANKQNAFTKAELEAMQPEALSKLAKLAAQPVENSSAPKPSPIFLGLDAFAPSPEPTINVTAPKFTKVDWKTAK